MYNNRSRARKHRPNRDEGVALILCLSIIALLMILAAAFISTSENQAQAAKNFADIGRAELLAKSALQRAIGFIRKEIASGTMTTYEDGNELFHIPTGTTWKGGVYAVTALTGSDVSVTPANVAAGYWNSNSVLWSLIPTDVTLHTDHQWVNVMTKIDLSGGTGVTASDSIIGRLTYLIIDETGKIDINSAIDSRVTGSVAEGSEVRIGQAMNEINIGDAIIGSTSPDEFREFLPANAPLWTDWGHLIRSSPFRLTDLSDQTTIDSALAAIFPFSSDIEAYFAGDTDYHRCNLALAATMTVDDLMSTDSQFWNRQDEPYSSGVRSFPSPPGIKWLSVDNTQCRQIAANIADYTDTNGIATNDFGVPADWMLTTATNYSDGYVGLEKVPYLNEFNISVYNNQSGSGNLEITLQVELINMYDTDIAAADYDVTVVVRFAHTSGGPETDITFTLTTGVLVSANSYAFITSATDDTTIVTADPDTISIIAIRAAVYTGGSVLATGTLMDFAPVGSSAALSLNDGETGWWAAEVHDPRHNMPTSEWSWEGVKATPQGSISVDNVDAVNDSLAFVAPNAGGPTQDTETIADPAAGLSTAYIHNGPMRSLWEIGAIHRAGRWQTLNIDQYNTTDTKIGTYANGDANILDHVKLMDRTWYKGKFNVNSRNDYAWRAMLGGIRVGTTYADPGNGGTELNLTWSSTNAAYDIVYQSTDIDLNTWGDGIFYTNGAKGGLNFKNRGEIAKVSNMSNDSEATNQDNDRAKEEIIGKIAQLLTTRQNYFTIIATAQTLVSVPTGYLDAITYDTAASDSAVIRAEHKILAVIYRDAFNNFLRIEHIEIIDGD